MENSWVCHSRLSFFRGLMNNTMQNTQRYIYEVYKERSFSRAAQNLYVSQPALSACIKKAEALIGMQLFDRSTLPIEPTEAGRLYIQAIRKIMAVEDELQTQISALSQLEQGHLVIGGSTFFASYMLPPLIQNFTKLYPGVSLKIEEDDTNTLYTAPAQEGVQLILDGGRCDETRFDRQTLFHEALLLAVPAANPLNQKLTRYALRRKDIIDGHHQSQAVPPVNLRRFRQETLILQDPGHDTNRRSLALCKDAGFAPYKTIVVNQLSTAANLAAQGLGCTFVTDSLVRLVPLPDQALCFYRLNNTIACREVFLAWRVHSPLSPAMQRFLTTAQEYYQDLDGQAGA